MTKHNISFDDFFHLPIFGFKTIGFDFLDTPKTYLMKRLLNIVAAFAFFSHLFCYIHMIQQFPSLDFRHNMLAIMITSGCIAFAINGNIKFFFLLANRKRVCKIYDFLKSIFPETIDERNIYRVNEYYYTKKEQSVKITFFTSCWLLAFAPMILSIVKFIHDVCLYGYVESHFQYMKFYETEYIINHRNPWTYILIYIFESANCHYLILTNLGTDLWLIPFATQVRMHLDHTSPSLETLNTKFGNYKKYSKRLADIIQNHQRLMILHVELKSTFEISMAFNIIATVGLLCAVAIRVQLIGLFNDFLFFSYLMSAVLQFYVLCYHGQKLTESSENVAEAAYNSQWYNASPGDKKMLLILMIRAARPAELSVVGGPPLSLDTFKIVLTVSYRIFAVFNSMME